LKHSVRACPLPLCCLSACVRAAVEVRSSFFWFLILLHSFILHLEFRTCACAPPSTSPARLSLHTPSALHNTSILMHCVLRHTTLVTNTGEAAVALPHLWLQPSCCGFVTLVATCTCCCSKLRSCCSATVASCCSFSTAPVASTPFATPSRYTSAGDSTAVAGRLCPCAAATARARAASRVQPAAGAGQTPRARALVGSTSLVCAGRAPAPVRSRALVFSGRLANIRRLSRTASADI
jgi:hypothetical protein